MASLNDLNGDGLTDLAIGADGDDTGGSNHGAVHVLFLGPFAQITINNPSIFEGDNGVTDAVFTVRAFNSTLPITVDYATADDSATTADSDYTASSGTLTFSPGESTKTITVGVNGDTAVEQDETFIVNLSNAVNADIVQNQGVATIQNDDPRFIINDVKFREGNSGTTDAVFNIALSIPARGA